MNWYNGGRRTNHMPSRQYKTDPCQLLAEGQILINTTDDAKFQHKVELVNLVLSGLSPSFLSQYCAESKNTITSWVKTAGRPAKLSSEELAQIKSVLEKDAPKEYGYSVWDGPSLSDYIAKTYSVSLCVRQCQRLLHNLGFSLVRPQVFPGKGMGNEEERESFKKN